MQTLEPCPFCAQPLTARGGINPYGFCETDGCWLSGARIGITCDDPKQVERWNTRPTPATGIEDLLKKTVAAFITLSPERQAEMMEEQRKSFAENNVALSRPTPAATDTGQHTICASCFVDKPTPLRRNEMGGYVCLTCVDKRLDAIAAASSTGLETVAWTNKAQLGFLKDDHWKVMPMAMWTKDYVSASNDDIELCDRSQAEELLAAKEAERTEQWRMRREAEYSRDAEKAASDLLEHELSKANKRINYLISRMVFYKSRAALFAYVLRLPHADQRQWLISTILSENGHFNRSDVSLNCSISHHQAINDIRRWKHENAGRALYNASTKRFERVDTGETFNGHAWVKRSIGNDS